MENSQFNFRAWDSKRREMVYFDLELCNAESTSWYDEQIKGSPLMQYTGLKDGNGKEIYEDDVVRFSRGGIIMLGKVKRFKDGRYFVYKDENNYLELLDNYIEIIGDIYENPELLDKEKK